MFRSSLAALIIFFLIGSAYGIKTEEVEIGESGTYDGAVKVERDVSGNMTFKDVQNPTALTLDQIRSGASGDSKVGVDSAATPGYLGATGSDGVLRTGSGLTVSDGGDYVTIDTVAETILSTEIDSEAELEALVVDVTNFFTDNDGALSDDDLSDNSTSDLAEGTNLYFTNARVASLLDTEAELEALVVDVTNFFTNNDGALSDDDLSDNSFTDLSDTISSYAGLGDYVLRVNSGATGIEAVDGDTYWLPISGGTLLGALSGTSAAFSSTITVGSAVQTDIIAANEGSYITIADAPDFEGYTLWDVGDIDLNNSAVISTPIGGFTLDPNTAGAGEINIGVNGDADDVNIYGSTDFHNNIGVDLASLNGTSFREVYYNQPLTAAMKYDSVGGGYVPALELESLAMQPYIFAVPADYIQIGLTDLSYDLDDVWIRGELYNATAPVSPTIFMKLWGCDLDTNTTTVDSLTVSLTPDSTWSAGWTDFTAVLDVSSFTTTAGRRNLLETAGGSYGTVYTMKFGGISEGTSVRYHAVGWKSN